MRPAQTETLAGTDHDSRLPLTRIVPTFLFRPPSARQRRREKSGTGPSNPRPREESLPGPTGPAPRVRAPRIPRKRLRPGLSELEPAGAQYAPDTVFRAPCTARVFLGITGPGPGETDSDVSLRQNPAARWTRMEDPHVRAGEVVTRKTPGHGTIRRARFIKGRPEQFVAPLS